MARHKAPAHLPLLLSTLLSPWLNAHAQNTTAPPISEGRLQYIGDTSQVSLGLGQGGRVQGELRGVLHETPTQTWLGEGWAGRHEGGLKLSHHWYTPSNEVKKIFIALDKNITNDQKFTWGYGLERPNWFGQINLSHGITGKRLISQQQSSGQILQTGFVEGAPYHDTITRLTDTRIFEKAYDHGIGMRIGRHLENHAIRLTAGLDHEWGRQQARQNTASFSAEKMYPGTPHSVALQISHSHKSGPAEPTRSDTRTLLIYRHSLGRNHNAQSERLYRLKTVAQPVTAPNITTVPPTPPPIVATTPVQLASTRIEKQWVKTKAIMNADAFFDFNSTRLTQQAQAELQRVAQLMQSQGREGPILITGHTCDIGSDKVNDRLSLARAQSVKNHLIALGIATQDDATAQGRGKRAQKFPATAATRAQNRRVELEFFSFVDQEKLVEIPVPAPAPTPVAATSTPTPAPATTQAPAPVITYEREAIAQAPAWIKRALRTPTEHKRSVSVYRFKETSYTETIQREWINQAPTARNDAYTLATGSTNALDVMGNDSDPDTNDTIRLVNVTAPQHGQVSIEGRQVIYRASATHVGPDSFSYTIEDSKGLQSTAVVGVVLTQGNGAPIAQADQYSALAGSTSTFNVLENDSDPDANDTIRLVNVTAPQHGQVSIEGRQVIYRASATHVGPDSFSYTIEDSKGLQATGLVGVALTRANRAPQANADHFGVSGRTPSHLAVLDNDTDPDGDRLVITAVTQPIVNSGTVVIKDNGITFIPSHPFLIDWFTYTISDGRGGTSTATVRLVDP
jgi:outer membrane protein OmpA-like peptidoglycan-associated protein